MLDSDIIENVNLQSITWAVIRTDCSTYQCLILYLMSSYEGHSCFEDGR
jgi:hypothetical protein